MLDSNPRAKLALKPALVVVVLGAALAVAGRRIAPSVPLATWLSWCAVGLGAFLLVSLIWALLNLQLGQWALRKGGNDPQWFLFGSAPRGLETLRSPQSGVTTSVAPNSSMSNRYNPPSAVVADIERHADGVPVTLIPTVRLLVLLVAIFYSLSFQYHDGISEFIGRHTPRFVSPYVFPGLIAEAFVIESVVCLPLIFPLAFLYGRFTLAVSLLLAAPVVLRAAWEAPYAVRPPLGPTLVAFHGLCHLAFLVVGSRLAWLRLQRSSHSIERAAASQLRRLKSAAHVKP